MTPKQLAALLGCLSEARDRAFAVYADDYSEISPWADWAEQDQAEFTAMINAAVEPIAAEVIRLRAEVAAWEKRFPACVYDGNSVVMGG